MNITKHILSLWLYPRLSSLILRSFIKESPSKPILKQCDELFADFTLIVLDEMGLQIDRCTHAHA